MNAKNTNLSGDVFDIEIRGYIKKTGEYVSDEEADAFSLTVLKNGRLQVLSYFRTLEEAKAYASKFVI
jgi:hypothetical protein